ncbi:MAG TPA: ATP-binding protein [Candidatus Polarisedimenticolaceae bacterium]|nr:ATP-binding protein [Candidatus Polarisedimenticolaceae bacterium]
MGGETTTTAVELVLPSDVKLVDLVHATSEKMAEFAGFDADEALNVGLALREAVINAMVHGNGQDPRLKVHISLVANATQLEAKIRDEGQGFDPDSEPDPTAEENLLNTSGRGLLLMRAFVDEVRFTQHEKRGMEITLTKKRTAS